MYPCKAPINNYNVFFIYQTAQTTTSNSVKNATSSTFQKAFAFLSSIKKNATPINFKKESTKMIIAT